ncbi:DHA2 family efflux MFS transporter permease subunit [Granulicella sp. L60]|uniref:DHA2 family efflux MFS transporter permease subunit n=1 Tax=Granulicella sp. L60 TaxID=1641866 RepID=UPI00131D0C4D|nr:DHA2 family efflux MFS transporter permease subunit [Granulicella sp. L60]
MEERWTPKHNPWMIAIVVSLATFMEVLDTSVANVALPHIAGSLGAGQDEATWVLTSYLVSNAVVLPIASYISSLIGRKRFYMTCVALFGISSLLCGLAPTLPLLLFFRVLQGAGGGGLAPSEQSILADTFPPEKRSQAFALYGMAIVLAPTVGPTLGGWLTDNFDWRWIFFINLPIVAISLFFTHRLVEDPPAIQKEVREARSTNFRLDYLGFGLLSLTFGTLEVVLDKGQEDDWFGSSFIASFAVISLVSFVAVILWELWLARKKRRPILDLTLFTNRNFTVAMGMMFVMGAALYGVNTLLPNLLQEVMGYTAEQSGITLIGGGVATMIAMVAVGIISPKVDVRWLIAIGFVASAASLFYMSGLNLQMNMGYASQLKFWQGFGIAFVFIPISTMSYVGVPANKNNDVSGMTNLARNIGGSCGTAYLTTMLARHRQVHQNALVRHTTKGNVFYTSRITAMTNQHLASGTSTGAAHNQALSQFYQQVQQQASVLSYIDIIFFFAFACLCMAPWAFMMKKNTSTEIVMH